MNQYDDYYYQQDPYYGQPQPAPQPVSLQPFKALKIVFLVLAIVNTVATVFLFFYFQAIGAVFDEFGSGYREIGEMYSSMGGLIILLECLPFAIAFWVLFGVFNKKYKRRLEHNRTLGYMDR